MLPPSRVVARISFCSFPGLGCSGVEAARPKGRGDGGVLGRDSEPSHNQLWFRESFRKLSQSGVLDVTKLRPKFI